MDCEPSRLGLFVFMTGILYLHFCGIMIDDETDWS